MLVCVMGFQGTEIRLGQSGHPLFLVFLHPLSGSSLLPGLLGPLTLRGLGLTTVPLTSALSALSRAQFSLLVFAFWVWAWPPLLRIAAT